MFDSSKSRRNLASSASRFLFSSAWAWVAPPASSKRSLNSSSSRSSRSSSALADLSSGLTFVNK
uniref:Secreted protein n=1 Tax=Romanomermis culicivorax TaxID=13658 RepID=A0A915JUD7_ROMCU